MIHLYIALAPFGLCLSYSMTVAYFYYEFPTLQDSKNLKSDRLFALSLCLLTMPIYPILVLLVYFLSGKAKYGLKF